MSKLTEQLEKVKNGTFMSVEYKSTLPVKAQYKHDIQIVKYSKIVVRTGVAYNHLASVIEKKAKTEANPQPQVQRANNFSWVVDNRIKYNSKTGKEYLAVAVIPNRKAVSSVYEVITAEGTTRCESFDKNLVIDSYWGDKDVDVLTIATDNVLSINGVKVI